MELSDKVILEDSADGTIVYTDVVTKCSDVDSGVGVSVISIHTGFNLDISGDDLMIRNMVGEYVTTTDEMVTLSCNGVEKIFNLKIEADPDEDNDGFCDLVGLSSSLKSCSGLDNCPTVKNQDQSDVDEDETGDSCDTCTDQDHDNYGRLDFLNSACVIDGSSAVESSICDTFNDRNPLATETCDDIDNNCNGETDEGCPCDYDEDSQLNEKELFISQQGVCSGVERVCKNDFTWSDYNFPLPYQEGTETKCLDELDNDCSGQTDCDDSNCQTHPYCIFKTLPAPFDIKDKIRFISTISRGLSSMDGEYSMVIGTQGGAQ